MTSTGRALDGNRIWRVDTATGPVVQKLYGRRGRWPREELRGLLTGIAGRKSSPRTAARRSTERRLLSLWARAGFDVPAELSEQHPALAGPDHLVLEDVSGAPLLHLLRRKARTPRERRDRLLRRFGADWSARHDLALRLDEPTFVQEHGSFDHVLVDGERFVSIDLEQAWLPGQPVMPLIAKEVADTLRSLAGRVDPDVFRQDLRATVDAYDDDERLVRVVAEYRSNPRPLRRLLWSADSAWQRVAGRRTSKYVALDALEDVLQERRGTGALSGEPAVGS